MKSIRFLLLFLSLGICLSLAPSSPIDPPPTARQWVDSVMASMSLEEKVGQLFMLATYSNKDEKEYRYVEKLIREQHLGGLIFMQGSPQQQLQLANRYQAIAKVPLLMSQDAEWGLDMRLKPSPGYPKNMTLGAITKDSLIYHMGVQMGRELKRVGIQLNFAPVVDVNNNPRNPVINYRSFGENKFNVSRKGIMISLGMQSEGVIACAKHFPGHGDTDADSHFSLPLIDHKLQRLDTLELYPFVKLMDAGVQSVMVAHLYIPALDPTPNQATSLSRKVVYDLIRDSLQYDGLVFTDALNMEGVTKFYSPGEVALKAFLAGNDILLVPSSIPTSARLIREAVEKGKITSADLDERVRRILLAKYQVGLNHWTPLKEAGLAEDMASPEHLALRRQLYEAAITLAKNEGRLIPFRALDQQKIACVQIGGSSGNEFDLSLRKYADVKRFFLRKNFTEAEKAKVLAEVKAYDIVVTAVLGMSSSASRNYGITEITERFSRELAATGVQTATVLFGSPYALRSFGKENAVIVAHEDAAEAQQAAASALFGGIAITGRLPVTASEAFKEGQGIMIRQPVRFGFARPEESGMNSKNLERIDSLANHYIDRMAVPGCQILVMRGNRIVYDKAFGRTKYGREGDMVDPYLHTYDLASVTKISATTLCTMRLVELGLLDLDAPLKTYLPDLAKTNKADLTARRLLQHNAGLPGWYPFYRDTYADESRGLLDRRFYSYVPSRSNNLQVAPALFGTQALKDTVWDLIKALPVRNTTRVRYSDISMILLGKVIESVSGRSLDELAKQWFYEPMGMNQTTFNPHRYNRMALCPPTEADTVWRHAIIQGYVHDPTAAIMGGVAGHAGLFSNIYDLAKLMLMVKSGGVYGGEQFLRPETISYFTRKQLSYSRKGLGWDKPETTGSRTNFPTSEFASAQTYGHTGFTGTCVWVDPTHDLVYIFLGNRTFPFASNRLLLRENVRTLIMDQIYASIANYGQIQLEK